MVKSDWNENITVRNWGGEQGKDAVYGVHAVEFDQSDSTAAQRFAC
jgi:hypothetical protein